MTVRRSERPTPGRLGKSNPPGRAGGSGRSTPATAGKASPARGSKSSAEPSPRRRGFEATWPLFSENAAPSFPSDPELALQRLAPPSADLAALAHRTESLPEPSRAATRERHKRDAGSSAPEWRRAAEALVEWLQQRLASEQLEPLDQATIARTWAAFCLGGATEPQILRVAHIVQRAHVAIRETPRAQHELPAAFHAAAGVVHAGLPSAIQRRMPLERVVYVVRRLRDQADGWAAIVEGTTELLGWTDYARVHAASVIRAVLERNREP